MDTWQRRTVGYVAGLTVLAFAFAGGYNVALRVFEGETQPFYRSLQFIVETFTATGYGSESPWQSPEMNVFVIVADFVGVISIFLALPVLLFPLFEEAISTTVPTAVDDLTGHVVVCSLSPRGETLITELESQDVPYVVVEPDREAATEHYEDGYTVVHADPQSVGGLQRAGLPDARAIVADDSDDVNTSVVLTAKEVAEDVQAISVVNEPDRARYHELAGADAVLSPRPLLGESLAAKVTAGVSTDLGDAVEVGEDFEIAEFPVHRGSDLVGRTIADSGIREETGANVIGAWFRGRFESPPPPEETLGAGTVLLATGHESQLGALREMTQADARSVGRGETVVAGYGEVGQTAAEALSTAGIPYTVLDERDVPGVDVAGDATEPDALRQAGIENVRTVILALPDDTATEVATLVARDLEPDVEIVARAEATENVQKTYRAGADYVLSLATVSGRMLASTILEETVVSLDTQIEVVRTSAHGLVGKTLGEADVRFRTGCTVVGVERDGTVRTDLGPDFRIERGDELVVAGTDDGTNRFMELLG
ncbi:metal transporter [Halobacteriales archaeon QH_10_67_22]|nr:MAG: metal transporter [Halobacteriales archaeon QH_10_67_22]